MKAVILAGGLGTRLSEETSARPKPMVEIGGKPILWHIMKTYSEHGIHDFVICCGYKHEFIKEYFMNYYAHTADVTVDLTKRDVTYHHSRAEPWRVTLVDTGLNTQTGGRLRRVQEYLKKEPAFCMTYGDGVSDVDITALVKFHEKHGKLATVTAVHPESRFGALKIENGKVLSFKEKPAFTEGKINGGYFVLSPKVIDFIRDDNTAFEHRPLSDLVRKDQLMAYSHDGFWKPMDTLRDRMQLEKMWDADEAPWKIW